MAQRQNDDAEQKADVTNQSGSGETDQSEKISASRRSLLKGAAATAATLGSVGVLSGGAAAVDLGAEGLSPGDEIDPYLDVSTETHVPPGEYVWNGGMNVSSGAALIGDGEQGDVVLNLQSGTMDGSIDGQVQNITVRGENHEPKAGLNLTRGSELNGFVWPEGGGQLEDRAFYNPDADGSGRGVVRNSAWAWMANNGAYTDKIPMVYENCAAVNNNIANIRIGHRTSNPMSETSVVRNCLVAVTKDVRWDAEGAPNARGVRMRHPGNFVIENCHFIYLDVQGASNPIELHSGAAGSSVTIRNCTFYNESDAALIRDKSGGEMDVTIENCVAVGSGSHDVQPDFSGSGITSGGDVSFPTPAEVTGHATANDIEGVGAGIGPWTQGGTTSGDTQGNENQSEYEHTLVLHGSPDNPISSTALAGDFDLDVTVSGAATLGSDAEQGSDSIVQNSDGGSTIEVNNLGPDELDSFKFNGEVTDFVQDDGYELDVSLDGTTMTPEELLNGGTSTDGSTSGSTDGSTSGSTDGSTSGSTDGSTQDHPHLLTVQGTGENTQYTFTVSGGVSRDSEASVVAEDSTPWDRMQDIAREGKVIGVVGSGTDAYRFSGSLTALTVDGDADVNITRNA